MRLDLFLKTSRLINKRTLAHKACDASMVTVNGIKAKPAREVSEGDVISVQTPSRILEVRVLRIPGRNVSKAETQSLYELLKDEALKWEP